MLDVHVYARQLIALTGAVSDTEEIWLRDHLERCPGCFQYSQSAAQAVSALHSAPFSADSWLVRSTQFRMRSRAINIRRRQERAVLVGILSFWVSLWTLFSASIFWDFCKRIGEWVGASALAWQSGFEFFYVTPTLVAGALTFALAMDGMKGARLLR